MPVFTAIGTALVGTAAVAAGTSAFAVGVGASVLALGAGAAAYSTAGGFDGPSGSGVDSRVSAATGAGKISEAEAQTAAKKRAYRSGVLFTSPTGLDETGRTSSAKLR